MERNTCTQEIRVRSNAVTITGDLTIPERASVVILFAHGSGSSRHSSRNKYIAAQLNRSGFATLLMDLLTMQEEREEHFTHHFRFDIDLLSERLCSAVDWLSTDNSTKNLAIGLFGASTGSAAAISCAEKRPERITSIVSRGGRPDLVPEALPKVLCPTLFIVGGFDPQVLVYNEKALQAMHCHREIEIIPGAHHLFEEVGKLDVVANMATWWFARHSMMQFSPSAAQNARTGKLDPSMLENRSSLESTGQHK